MDLRIHKQIDEKLKTSVTGFTLYGKSDIASNEKKINFFDALTEEIHSLSENKHDNLDPENSVKKKEPSNKEIKEVNQQNSDVFIFQKSSNFSQNQQIKKSDIQSAEPENKSLSVKKQKLKKANLFEHHNWIFKKAEHRNNQKSKEEVKSFIENSLFFMNQDKLIDVKKNTQKNLNQKHQNLTFHIEDVKQYYKSSEIQDLKFKENRNLQNKKITSKLVISHNENHIKENEHQELKKTQKMKSPQKIEEANIINTKNESIIKNKNPAYVEETSKKIEFFYKQDVKQKPVNETKQNFENLTNFMNNKFNNDISDLQNQKLNISQNALLEKSISEGINELISRAKVQIGNNEFSAQIRLNPSYFGYLSMDMKVIDNQLVLKILVDNKEVYDKIMENMESLKNEFIRNGFQIENFTVKMKDNQFFHFSQQDFMNTESFSNQNDFYHNSRDELLFNDNSESIKNDFLNSEDFNNDFYEAFNPFEDDVFYIDNLLERNKINLRG